MKSRLAIIAILTILFPHATNAETVSIDPPAEPVVVASPGVKITLTATPTSIAAGQDVTYTLTVTNTGDAAFTNLSAQFDLPTGFSFVGGTSPSALKNLGTLAPQASVTKSFTLQASSSATTGRVPLEVLVDATELELNETIAMVEVRAGQVLGAETLVETGTSPLGIMLIGVTTIAAGFFLQRQRRAE